MPLLHNTSQRKIVLHKKNFNSNPAVNPNLTLGEKRMLSGTLLDQKKSGVHTNRAAIIWLKSFGGNSKFSFTVAIIKIAAKLIICYYEVNRIILQQNNLWV